MERLWGSRNLEVYVSMLKMTRSGQASAKLLLMTETQALGALTPHTKILKSHPYKIVTEDLGCSLGNQNLKFMESVLVGMAQWG